MTVDQALSVLHHLITDEPSSLSASQLHAVCIATSVLTAQLPEMKTVINNMWATQPIDLRKSVVLP